MGLMAIPLPSALKLTSVTTLIPRINFALMGGLVKVYKEGLGNIRAIAQMDMQGTTVKGKRMHATIRQLRV